MSLASNPPASIHSPRSGRAAARSHPSSPWSHAAPSSPPPSLLPPEPSDRSPENAAAPSETLESNGDLAAASQGKKQAWNRPSNGSMEAGPVMGADSWPALSRAAPKSSSSNSLKALSDGLVSAAPEPVIASASPNHPNPNATTNHVAPAQQKSMKRGGGGGASSSTPANGGPVLPPPPPALVELPHVASDKQDGPVPSPKAHPIKGSSNWDNGSRGGGITPQSHSGGNHHRGYGGNRRGGGGGRGSHHGGFGIRRDHERGSYDWNPPRSFSGRDVHVPPPQQHRSHPRPFLSPPLPATSPAPFISPPPSVRSFVNPMGFPDIPSHVYYVPTPPPPESLRGMPFVAHPALHAIPPGMLIAAPDHQHAILVKQIDYYFSSDNLCKDIFLRQNMDEQGWVPIALIAGFNRVKQLTNNIQYILDAVRSSTIVEVQGDKIRSRNDWMNWILPPSLGQHGTTSSPQSSAAPSYEVMVAHMQGVGLEERDANDNSTRGPTPTNVGLSRTASGNFRIQSQVGDTTGEGNAQN